MLCSDLDDMEDDNAYRFGGPLYDRRNNSNNNYQGNNNNNSGSSSPPPLYDNNHGGLSKKNRNRSTSTGTGSTPPPLYDRRSPPTTILTQSTQPKKHSSQLKKHPTRPPHPLYRNKSPSSSSAAAAAANDDTMMAASTTTTTTTTSSIIDFEEQIKADDYLFEQQLEDQMSSLQLQHHPLDHLSMSLNHQHHHQHQPSYQQHHQHQPYDFQYGVQSTDISQRVNLRTEDDSGRPGIGLQLEVPDSSTIFSTSSFSVADNDNNNNSGNDDNMELMLDPQVAALLGYPLSAADSTTSSMITAVNNPVMLSNGTNIMYHKNISHSNNGRLNNDSSSSPTNITMTSNNGISSPSRVVDPYSKSPSPSSNSHQQQHHLASVGLDDPLHSLLFDDDPSLNSADYVSIHTAMPALSFAFITIILPIIILITLSSSSLPSTSSFL